MWVKNWPKKIPISKKHNNEYMDTHTNDNSIYLTPTNSDEILKIITDLKNKKSSGHDGINSMLLRELKSSVCDPLAIIFNKSLETGELPSSLKLAKIVPIYKSKDKEEFKNYRPVSLLPCISKILEKIIHKRLYNFLLLQNIFYESQYGFRPKHSTINAVTELSNHVINSIDNKQCTLAVFLDLSKAFDTIDHMTLLAKLAHYGIRGVALEWFRSYLTNRKQYVQIKDEKSATETITYGVPQGSVLGPLLFIIYTNDLPKSLIKTKTILFADDTTIFKSSNNIETLYSAMNEDLRILEDWFKANKLSLNASKTNYILFRNKKSEFNYTRCKLMINGKEIGLVSKTKFLGIIIDQHLEWKYHIDMCKKKISSGNYVLKSLKNSLTTSILTTIYYSMIHPYISYGLMLWGSAYKSYLHMIEILQKKAIRNVHKTKYNEHTMPLFRSSKILKIEDMYKLQLLMFMFSYYRNILPSPLYSLFTRNCDVHDHYTRCRKDPRAVARNTHIMTTSFICKGPELWGALSQNTKESKSLSSFKKQIKNIHINTYTN